MDCAKAKRDVRENVKRSPRDLSLVSQAGEQLIVHTLQFVPATTAAPRDSYRSLRRRVDCESQNRTEDEMAELVFVPEMELQGYLDEMTDYRKLISNLLHRRQTAR